MSAPARACETLAEPIPSTTATASVASPVPARVLIPGTWRTFENREVLRGMGLRWDPPTHAWHGALTPRERTVLRERFGLVIRPVVALEAFAVAPGGVIEPGPTSVVAPPPKPPRGPSPSISTLSSLPSRVRDGSRTRAEARIVLKPGVPDPYDPESQFNADTGREFSWWEITSGLPDDSREADECAEARRIADLRGRVKFARAVVATTPGLAKSLALDGWRASRFCAQFRITAEQLRFGVPAGAGSQGSPV